MRLLALAALLFAAPAFAQQQPALRQVTPTPGAGAGAASPAAAQTQAQQRAGAALRTAVPSQVNIGPISARDAVQWISTATDLPVVVHWDKLLVEGVDATQQVQLSGVNLTAEGAISQVMQQIAVDNNLIMETTPWYVEIMTKTQASQNPVIIVYPIGDLMMTIPNFTDAPEFDLSAISQGGGSGGGGGSGNLFTETQEEEIVETELERGGRIADLIRQSVEPELWRENGGLYGSITYFNKHLIVRAPMYVHRQIGGDGIRAGSAGRISPGPGSPSYTGGVTPTPGPGTVTGVSSYVNVTGQLDSARVQSLRRVPVYTPIPRNQPMQATPRRGSNVGVTPTITRVR